MKQKERAIDRASNRIKMVKKDADDSKCSFQKEIVINDKKSHKVIKKKQKLCAQKKKLESANVRLKQSIANRNEKIRTMIDEKQELVCKLSMLCTETEISNVKIEAMREHKNCKAWPLFIVKVITEMLDNGAPPFAIAKNLVSSCMLICSSIRIIELLNADHICKQRGTLRILTECCAMHILAKNLQWRQLLFDNTSRRTVAMTTFTAGIIENNQIRPIIMQAAKVGLGETAEKTVDIMKEILDDGREYLERLIEACEHEFPDYAHDVPPASSVVLKNFRTCMLSSNACNTAQKTRRLTKNQILREINNVDSNYESATSEGKLQNTNTHCY